MNKLKLLFMLLFGIIVMPSVFVYADTNGVWHYASDVRSGTFGANEGFGDFIFNSTLYVNNSNFYVMNGNIGIGTNSPSYKLDVIGTGRFTSNLYSLTLNTGHGDNELYAMDQNVTTTDSPTFAKINTGLGAMEVNTIARYSGNQNLRTNDSPSFNNLNSIRTIYGDYGTMIQSTDEWLRLNGGNTHTNGVYISSKLRADGGIYVGDDEYIYRYAEDTLRTTDNFMINGNVGIGTVSPTVKLQVNGDIKANNIYSNGQKVATQDYVDSNAGGGVNYKKCYDNDVYWYDSAGNRLAKDEECGDIVLGYSRPDCQNYNGGAYCGLCLYHSYDPKIYIYNDHAIWNDAYINPFGTSLGYDLTATDMLGFIASNGHLYWRGNLKYGSSTYEICKSNGYAS